MTSAHCEVKDWPRAPPRVESVGHTQQRSAMGPANVLLLATAAADIVSFRYGVAHATNGDGSSAANMEPDADTRWSLPSFPQAVSPVERVVYITLAVVAALSFCYVVRWSVQRVCGDGTRYTEIWGGGNPDAARDSSTSGSAIGTRLCKSANQHQEYDEGFV